MLRESQMRISGAMGYDFTGQSCEIPTFSAEIYGDSLMPFRLALLGLAPFLLAACVETQNGDAPSPFIQEVPEGVLSIAAGGQDLTAMKIDPIDGCYTYRHIGPVETTFLPLRAKNGRPICTRAS